MKLQREGLFEPSRKRPLPPFPRRVAVVTSPTGAVWQDIRNVIGRRYPLVELVMAPTPVQGEEAAPGIVDALRAAGEADVDLVIVARGGGSLEDLWAFNEESVARAVYSSPVPVVSAVGHETDVTIADLVADVRAPTPSAAAEMAVPDAVELARRISTKRASATAAVASHLTARSEAIRELEGRLFSSAPRHRHPAKRCRRPAGSCRYSSGARRGDQAREARVAFRPAGGAQPVRHSAARLRYRPEAWRWRNPWASRDLQSWRHARHHSREDGSGRRCHLSPRAPGPRL